MATHSSILVWRILWTEGFDGLQSMGHKESDSTKCLIREKKEFLLLKCHGKGLV